MTAEPLPRSSLYKGHVEDRPSVGELLGAVRDLGKTSPELQASVARFLGVRPSESGRRLRLTGRARKVSVSMPEDLMVAVQQRVGRGEFSQYVTEAVAVQFEQDLVTELSALLEAEHGSISDEALAEARRSWPDVQ